MRTIHKYPLEAFLLGRDAATVHIPRGAECLRVEAQHGAPVIYANIDPDERRLEPHTFRIVGTGHPIPDGEHAFIGTFKTDEAGTFVFHVFRKV